MLSESHFSKVRSKFRFCRALTSIASSLATRCDDSVKCANPPDCRRTAVWYNNSIRMLSTWVAIPGLLGPGWTLN